MTQLKMAKSSPQEMVKILEFFNGLEAIFEGEFEQNELDYYDVQQQEALSKYMTEWWEKFLSFSWERFYWGFNTLLLNAVDPDLSYLDWKPEIAQMLKLPEFTTQDEDGYVIATHKRTCGGYDPNRGYTCDCGFYEMAHFGKDTETAS